MRWDTRGRIREIRGRRAPLDFKPQRKILILGAAGVVLLIVIIAVFSRGGNEPSPEDLASMGCRLEEGITRLEGMEVRVTFLEKRERELEQSILGIDRSVTSLSQRLDKLAQKLDGLQISLREHRYHEVRSGDSLYLIAQQYGITVDELCRLNHIDPKKVIYPGQRLLIAAGSNE